ncbi:MAG TPA: diguanylate cyclase [Povalibacter sp.]|nr:diguanylate cyclase [Povalibacter sp.]
MSSDATSLKQLQTIIDVQARITDAAFDLDAFMIDVVDAAERLTNAKGAVVELVDGDDMVYRCASAPLAQFVGLRLARAGSLSGLCVAERRVLRCDDTENDQRVNREACRRIGVGSMVCTPLFQRGEPVGVLKVMASEAHRFNQYDVQTLRLVAGALGAALGNQLAFEAKHRVEMQLRESQARLELSEARMRTLLQHANDAVVSMDAKGIITDWNESAARLFGWSSREAIGREAADLIVPEAQREAHRSALANVLRTGDSSLVNERIELHTTDRAGEERVVEMSLSAIRVGERWEFLGFLHDIAERKRFERQLQQLALEDSLTGLPNRRALMEATDRALARAKRHGHSFAVLYMDLNGFKQINDVYGHQVGDLALQEFAKRIASVVRPTDLVARLGGDEFAILAEEIATHEGARALADKIHEYLRPPLTDPPLVLRTSIGTTLYAGQKDASALLREADASMYQQKRQQVRAAT